MISLSCFVLSLWVFSLQCCFVSNTFPNFLWFTTLIVSAFLFYTSSHIYALCFSWSLMGSSSFAIVGSNPTYYSWNSLFSMIWVGMFSTFLCFSNLFLTYVDLDQSFDLNFSFPSEVLSVTPTFIYLLGLSMNGLMYPFSYWILDAMNGVPIMSSLVHSLTVVFGGVFLVVISLFEGWISFLCVEFFTLLFLASSMVHSLGLIFESNMNSVLAWSTAFSINLSHISIPWDPSFSFLYGIFHGFANSFLFLSIQGNIDLVWNVVSGLLGGFPMTLVWNMNHYIVLEISSSFMFYTWSLFVYGIIFINLGFNNYSSLYNTYLFSELGELWFMFSILISLVLL